MELVKANPDIETLKLVLWIAAGVIVLLITVVSTLISVYFTGQRKRIEDYKMKQDAQTKEFTVLVNEIKEKQDSQYAVMREVVDSMKDTVNELKTLVRILEDRQVGQGKSCIEKHQVIDHQIENIGNKVDEHETRITVIETKIEKI